MEFKGTFKCLISKYQHTSQMFQTITESVSQESIPITRTIPNFQLSLPIAKMLGKRMLRAPEGPPVCTGLRYECITSQHITVLGVSEVYKGEVLSIFHTRTCSDGPGRRDGVYEFDL